MLRFFRTIRKKLIEEDNVRTYLLYAIGEIFLVVIGILIALQINNWNENRKDRQEETRLLTSIQMDLQRDIEQLTGIIGQAQVRQAQADSILLLLYQEPSPDMDEFIRLNRSSIAFENHFQVNSGTFDESQSAGSVKLIRNDGIRQQIFSYYRETKGAYTDRNTVKQIYEEVFPVFFRKVVATESGIKIWKDIETTLPAMDVKELAQDRDYVAMIVTKVAAEMFQIGDWQEFLKAAEELENDIAVELSEID
jgi:hypothetical protein